jgi:hypothetical protein
MLEYVGLSRFKRLPVSLSLYRSGFDPRPVYVGFVVEKVGLGEAFLRVL